MIDKDMNRSVTRMLHPCYTFILILVTPCYTFVTLVVIFCYFLHPCKTPCYTFIFILITPFYTFITPVLHYFCTLIILLVITLHTSIFNRVATLLLSCDGKRIDSMNFRIKPMIDIVCLSLMSIVSLSRCLSLA